MADHIKEGDGFADITLAKPSKINGETVSALRMREPTVADQKAAMTGANDADREISLFANLCECAPSDIEAMTMRNYGRLQAAYRLFTD